MAAKNSVKSYLNDSYYHIYNRGVEKRNIFLDSQDYAVFLSYLKNYLLPKDELKIKEQLFSENSTPKQKDQALKALKLKNFAGDIELVCYALMPNHFHILLWQKSADGIDRFLNSLATRYVQYFNKKYKRVGPLFQGVYKAVLVTSEEQLLHLSRYIHLNPLVKLKFPSEKWSKIKTPFSLPEYLGARKTEWIKSNHVLSYFNKLSKQNTYASFMGESFEFEYIKDAVIDFEDPD